MPQIIPSIDDIDIDEREQEIREAEEGLVKRYLTLEESIQQYSKKQKQNKSLF